MRTALRNQLALHAETVKQTVARRTLSVGLLHYSRAELEAVVAAAQRLQIQVVGLARMADDVRPKLATAAIESVNQTIQRALARRSVWPRAGGALLDLPELVGGEEDLGVGFPAGLGVGVVGGAGEVCDS